MICSGSEHPSAKDKEKSVLHPKGMTGRLADAVHHFAKQITGTYRHSLRLIFGEVYVAPAYR